MTEYNEINIYKDTVITVDNLNTLVQNQLYCRDQLVKAPYGLLAIDTNSTAFEVDDNSLRTPLFDLSFTCRENRLIAVGFSCPYIDVPNDGASAPRTASILGRIYVNEVNISSWISGTTVSQNGTNVIYGAISHVAICEAEIPAGINSASIVLQTLGDPYPYLKGDVHDIQFWVEDMGPYTVPN